MRGRVMTAIYVAFFEQSPDAIVVVDERGVITRVNQQAETMFGYRRPELLNQPVEILLPERFRAQHIMHRTHYMKQPRLRPMGADLELFGCHKDGHELAINIMLSPIVVDEQHYVIAVIRDVTEQQEVAEALQESERRFRALFEQSPYALFLNGADDRIVDVNPAACQLTGYSRDELIGMRVPDLQAPEVRGAAGRVVLEEFTRGDFLETVNLHRDGRRIPVEVRTSQLVWDDQSLMLSIVRDITERKEALMELQASLREKEVMLKEIHHRVKNNLQIVSSLLKLQAGHAETPQARGALRDSQNRIRAMALVHETLYQSKDLASLDFGQYVTQLVNHLRKAYVNIQTAVSVELAIEPLLLDVDTAVSCGLIINELVSNAFKYAFPPEHYSSGEITIALRSEGEGQMRLQIQDNGVGMPAEVDFERTETLGLQLVNTLVVDELDGTIILERRDGTSFTMMLPVPDSAARSVWRNSATS